MIHFAPFCLHQMPGFQPVVGIFVVPADHVVDQLRVQALRGNGFQPVLHHFANVVGEERLRIHGGDEHAAVNAVAVIHDVAHAIVEAVGNLRHAGRNHAKYVRLDLEIDVVGVQVIARISGKRRKDAFADVGEAGVVGVPDLADFRVPFVGHGDGIDVDAVAAQAIEEQKIDVDVVVVRRAEAGMFFLRKSPRNRN